VGARVTTFVPSHTFLSINDYYPVFLSFANSVYRASCQARHIYTVVAKVNIESQKGIGVLTPFNGGDPYPAGWPRWHIVPVLTSYDTGITPIAPGLVKEKPELR